jgi:broad specificity phosphatase PhoE
MGWGAAAEKEAMEEAPTTVILVRHAEKEKKQRDPGLTEAGHRRAKTLSHMLQEAAVDAIYVTPFKRTTGTAAPIAESLGMEVQLIEVSADFPQRMAQRIRQTHRGQVVLVVSHSNTTPAIIDALGAGPAPPIDEREYDDFFIVTLGQGDTAHLLNLRYGDPTP